jgi:hypothetical protein
MASYDEDELHVALWALHDALLRRDGLEARISRDSEVSASLLDRSLAASDAVLRARVGIHRLLIDWGWTPPPSIAKDIAYDDEVLRQPTDRQPTDRRPTDRRTPTRWPVEPG